MVVLGIRVRFLLMPYGGIGAELVKQMLKKNNFKDYRNDSYSEKVARKAGFTAYDRPMT